MLKLLAATAAVSILLAGDPIVDAVSHAEPVSVAGNEHAPADQPHGTEPAMGDPLPAVSLVPSVDVVGGSEDDRIGVEEALERFRLAGLPLPALEIAFHDDDAACKGHDGLFQPQHTPWRVQVCSGAAFVVTHELAHAWERANVDDAQRERYVADRGLETWSSPEAEWRERGIEDAAFVVQQNLMARHVDPSSDRWAELTAAFEMLTGTSSPVLAADGA